MQPGLPRGPLIVKNLPANAGDIKDTGLIPGSGRSPEREYSYPLQCSCLESLMDRGASRSWGLKESDTTGAPEHAHRMHVLRPSLERASGNQERRRSPGREPAAR